MSNYSLSVCLTDLPGALVQSNMQGQPVISIPIAEADLFHAQNGKVYLNLAMWAKRNGPDQYGKTHGIKQSLSQARQQALGDAAKNTPFIGSAKEIVPKTAQPVPQQSVYQQQAPQGYSAPQYPQQPTYPPSNNDLPF